MIHQKFHVRLIIPQIAYVFVVIVSDGSRVNFAFVVDNDDVFRDFVVDNDMWLKILLSI